jgi:hypothetical protein
LSNHSAALLTARLRFVAKIPKRFLLSKAKVAGFQNMSYINLNKREVALLESAVRRGDEDEGFEELLITLVRLTNIDSGEIFIPKPMLSLIQRYGGSSSKPVWRATLHSIFGRSMGESFGRKAEKSDRLIELQDEAAAEAARQNAARNRRVV